MIANDKVPPIGPYDGQAPQGDQENEVSVVALDMNNQKIMAAILTLAQTMTTQASRDVGTKMNTDMST